jgi:hypothetical protein
VQALAKLVCDQQFALQILLDFQEAQFGQLGKQVQFLLLREVVNRELLLFGLLGPRLQAVPLQVAREENVGRWFRVEGLQDLIEF